jgi:hypothetical protein
VFVYTPCETSTVSDPLGGHPTGPGSIPAYPYRPALPAYSPFGHTIGPQPVFFKTTLANI